jgi:tripartite motif-containing protein 71
MRRRHPHSALLISGCVVLLGSCNEEPTSPPSGGPEESLPPEFVLSFSGGWTGLEAGAPSGIDVSASAVYVTAETTPYKYSGPGDVFTFTRDGTSTASWDLFGRPMGLALQHDGTLAVVDNSQESVTLLTGQGEKIKTWGSPQAIPGWLNYPIRAATDDYGDIFVADYAGEKIVKSDANGSFIQDWYTPQPEAIAVGPSGRVYVAEVETNKLRVYSGSGALLETRALNGESLGLALDKNENLYAADRSNSTISKYDPSGQYLRSWGIITGILDVSVDADTVYALRSASPSVIVFGPGGNQVRMWHAGSGSAIDVESGDVYVMGGISPFIRHYTRNGELISEWGGAGSGPGEFKSFGDLTLGLDSTLYVVDVGNRRVEKIKRDGVYLLEFGRQRLVDGIFSGPTDLDLDSRSNIYVADTGNNRIQKFTPDGFYLLKWGSGGGAEGEFNSPRGLAVDDSDRVWVWDTGNHRVQCFDDQGRFLRQWPAADSLHVLEPWPNGIVGIDTGPGGDVYLVDSGRQHVVKFDGTGAVLTRWGEKGTDPGMFLSPRNIAVDPGGSVYVTDPGAKTVLRFVYPSKAH